MDEATMAQIFSEALRLYAEWINRTQALGPFKKLLTANYVIVKVQLDAPLLKITEVEEIEAEPKIIQNQQDIDENSVPTEENSE